MSAPPYPKIENLYRSLDGSDRLDIGVIRRPETPLIKQWLATEKIDGTNIRVSLEPEGEDARGSALGDAWEKIRREGPWVVDIRGRTNKADTPDFLEDYLRETFPLEKMKLLWRGQNQCPECKGSGFYQEAEFYGVDAHITVPPYERCKCVEPYPITIYGEGYGARIQRGGGDYRKQGDVSFRLFDVLVADKFWLTWENVVLVAARLGIKTVPLVPVIEYGSPAMAVRSHIAVQADIVDFVREGFKSIVAEAEGTPRLAEGIVARTDPYLFNNNGRRVVFKTKTKDF